MSDKQHFAFRLVPPRPTFAADMTPAEAATMAEHAEYWRGLLAEGTAVVFGPVLDPDGVYGLAVVEVDDAGAVETIVAGDPAVSSGLGRMHVAPMAGAIVRPAG